MVALLWWFDGIFQILVAVRMWPKFLPIKLINVSQTTTNRKKRRSHKNVTFFKFVFVRGHDLNKCLSCAEVQIHSIRDDPR